MLRTFIALRQVEPGLHAPRGGPDVRPRHTGRLHQRSPTGGAHVRERGGTTGAGAGRHLRRSLVLDHDGRGRQRQLRRHRGIPGPGGHDGQAPAVQERRAGLFRDDGNRLVAGRSITWNEIYEQRPVVVISGRSRARTWESRRRAIGKRVRGSSPRIPWREIVGVSGNERDDGLTQPPTAIVYWPMLNESYRWRTMAYAVRSPGRRAGFPPRARAGRLVGQSESAARRPCRHSRKSRRAR